jgi:hypothetical protein
MSSFDTSTLIRAEKFTAAEKTTVSGVVDTVKHLHKLIEDSRPTNANEHRKAKDAAHDVLKNNPTPATIAAYKAALGNYLNPEAVFQPVSDILNHLIDVELKKLVPVAKRLHSAASSAAQDPKRFGLEAAEAIEDIGERGEALSVFATGHKALLESLAAEATDLDNERTALHWLTQHGFCERFFG